VAGLLSLALAAGAALVLSRPLPPVPLSPARPVLEEPDVVLALTGQTVFDSETIPGQGPGAGEYLLVTAERGPAAALLPALARAFTAHGPGRSLLLAVGEAPGPPGAVAAHVHLDYRVEEQAGMAVAPAGGYPPLWLRQLTRAAVAREAGAAREGPVAQFRELDLAAGLAAAPFPGIALEGTGPDPLDLATFGRAVERLLHSLDELPVIPRPDPAGMGRSSTLYLVVGQRYIPAPGLWLVQLVAFLPLGVGVGRGLRRVRRWRWLDDEATILAAVQAYRFDRGKSPPAPGQTRAERRRRQPQGAWRPLGGEAAWWSVWLGGALAVGAGLHRELPPALAGAALALAGWLAKGAGEEQPAEDRRWALLALLAAGAAAAVLLTRGSPVVLVAFYPAALLWPALAPGRPAGNGLRALLGLTGVAWLLAGPGRPAPWPTGFVLLLVVTLAACALRLALERTPDAGVCGAQG